MFGVEQSKNSTKPKVQELLVDRKLNPKKRSLNRIEGTYF